MIVVAVTMPPRPVFLLFLGPQLAKIAMRIAMVLVGPLVVIDDFAVIPDMIVGIVRIIDPVVMMLRASGT